MNYSSYSPGVHKLIHHLDHLKKIKNGDKIAPLHVSVWPSTKCQLNCSYCCCGNQDKNGELDINDFKNAINVLVKNGTKAIEISGGGEPLLWNYFNEGIKYCYEKGLKISLITNGLVLNKFEDNILKMFDWIRVSLVTENQINKIDFDRVNSLTRVNASYIFSKDDSLSIIDDINKIAEENDIIIRIGLQRPWINEMYEETFIEENINVYDKLFFSKKSEGTPLGCYMAWIRAAIDWKGNFLPCPSIQLNEDSEGKIPETFPLCHIRDLDKWLDENRPNDLGYRCNFCNCGKDHNDLIYNLKEGIEDVDFV